MPTRPNVRSNMTATFGPTQTTTTFTSVQAVRSGATWLASGPAAIAEWRQQVLALVAAGYHTDNEISRGTRMCRWPESERRMTDSTSATRQSDAAPIRLLLCEDQTLMRQGLRTVLDLEPGFVVVGEAADGAEAVRLAAE